MPIKFNKDAIFEAFYTLLPIVIFVYLFFQFMDWKENIRYENAPKLIDIEKLIKMEGIEGLITDVKAVFYSKAIEPGNNNILNVKDGRFIILNQSGWKLSVENQFLKRSRIPKRVSDISYVLVIGNPSKVSAGRYKNRGSNLSTERFVSEYRAHLISNRAKKIVGIETITSPSNPRGIGLWAMTWEEDQEKIRPSILQWLYVNNIAIAPQGSGKWL